MEKLTRPGTAPPGDDAPGARRARGPAAAALLWPALPAAVRFGAEFAHGQPQVVRVDTGGRVDPRFRAEFAGRRLSRLLLVRRDGGLVSGAGGGEVVTLAPGAGRGA